MLKHKFIIDKLSEKQKIRILADVRSLADVEYTKLGLPEFKLSDVEDYMKDMYPSPFSLTNSWSSKTITDVVSDMSAKMYSEGISTALLPSPVAKMNMVDLATSEDPLLASKITARYISAFARTGIGTVVDGAYLSENNVSRLDKKPNSRFINEFVLRPLKKSVVNSGCHGVTVSSDIDFKNYETVNTYITNKINTGEGTALGNCFIFCKNIAPEDTINRISQGHICLDGSETHLRMAIDKYKRLKKQIDNGYVSICELDAEIENGTAFPIEKLDEAVDRVIDFAFECRKENKGKLTSYNSTDSIVKAAIYDSTVLLKNENNILPLSNSVQVAVVGDIIVNYNGNEPDAEKASEIVNCFNSKGCQVTNFFKGYSMNEDRSEDLLKDIGTEIDYVNTVILFMGTNSRRESLMAQTQNLYLPANQLAALDKIHSLGKKIIAVVSSDMAIDVTFEQYVDALMIAPLNSQYSLNAVVDMIMGRGSPSGRLSKSLYRDTDLIDRKQSYYLGLPNSKVGTFVGYRYYDSADYDVAYPFGYGLGYTSFQYSNLYIRSNEVVFTVKNVGNKTGSEVAQVYVGKKASAQFSPKKSLAGYEKVTLGPGESKTVNVSIEDLELYDSTTDQWVFERGDYTVYVGSSVRDIKLIGSAFWGNATLTSLDESPSDYLQSVTNIISDRYTLEADYKLMKRNVRNIVFGVGSLCLAISMFLFALITKNAGIFFLFVASVLAISGIIFFILEGVDRSNIYRQERARIKKANTESFKNAESIKGFSTAKVFADEFDRTGNRPQNKSTPAQAKADNYLEYVNDKITFESALKEFVAFAASKGQKFDENSAREIFAAMSSSRLIITRGMTTDSFFAIIKLISEYFGTVPGIDVVDASYVDDNSALFKKVDNVARKTALAGVIERSSTAKEKVHIAALSEVTFAQMSNYFVPFARYIRNPRNANVITATGEGDKKVNFEPSENMWFFINLKIGETFENIPSYISELASVIKIESNLSVPVALLEPTKQFSYYQFDFMLEKMKSNNGIPENSWKKIDALENFVNSSIPYAISNRICISVEKFYSVFNACGGDDKEALDRSLAARILPSMIVALDGVENAEDKNVSEKLGMLFGEENVEVSRSAVRASGTTVL